MSERELQRIEVLSKVLQRRTTVGPNESMPWIQVMVRIRPQETASTVPVSYWRMKSTRELFQW